MKQKPNHTYYSSVLGLSKLYNRKEFILFGASIVGSFFLKACSNEQVDNNIDTENNSENKFKVAIVLPGIITDQAWNEQGYKGIEEIKAKLGAEIAFVEQVGQADQVEALSRFAQQGYNLVYAHGGQFDTSIEQVAPQYPETFFVGVNGAISGDNMASLRIAHIQASYLCGIVGASMTKSNKMAYITAQSFEAMDEELHGFELGAKSINPEIVVTASYTGDWNDAAKAKEATLALISTGADVIFHWLDNAGSAVLEAAQQQNVWAIGNTVDQFSLAPQAVLTSSVKRFDLAIAYLAELAQQKQLEGKIYTIGLDKSDILYLGKVNPQVPTSVMDKVMTAQSEIIEGKLSLNK